MLKKMITNMSVLAMLAALAVPAAAAELADVGAGDKAADFTLADTEGNTHSLAEYLADGKVVVLEWFNPDCPYVQKYYDEGVNPSLDAAYAFADEQDIVWLAINSGAPGKQGAGVERNTKAVSDWGIPYPVLLDETGSVGMSYGATNTPQMFVIYDDTVVYMGGVDDAVTAGDTPQNAYLLDALKAVKAGEEVPVAETKHPGCGVKYAK